MTITRGQSAAYVADKPGVHLVAVYEGLSYFYGQVEEMRELERGNGDAFERVREESLKPKDAVR